MELHSLFEKIDAKLASQTDEELLLQKYDAEISELALKCYKRKLAEDPPATAQPQESVTSSLKDSLLSYIQNSISKGKDFLLNDRVGQSVGLGVGGAAVGGLIGSQLGSQKEFETKEDYNRRRINSALTGGLAGGAIGASIPTLKSLFAPSASAQGSQDATAGDAVRAIIKHPKTVIGGAGAAGGAVVNHLRAKSNTTAAASAAAAAKDNFASASNLEAGALKNELEAIKMRAGTTAPGGAAFDLSQRATLDRARAVELKLLAEKSLEEEARLLGNGTFLKFNFLKNYPTLQKILSKPTSKKVVIPAAAAAGTVALWDTIFGQKAFSQPVLDK